MIRYDFDRDGLDIREMKNENDVEFHITIKDEEKYLPSFLQVRDFFNNNNIHTDVLFYSHPERVYQIIVREDYYSDFVLSLFKHRLLRSVSWG